MILKYDTNCLLLLQALLSAHDQVAVKSFIPHLPEIAHEVDEDDEASVKIVRLVKGTTEPLVSRPIHLQNTYFVTDADPYVDKCTNQDNLHICLVLQV